MKPHGLLLVIGWWLWFGSTAEAVNPVAPKVFLSTDSGAAVLSGTAGTLLTLLDTTLIINSQFTAVSGASFVDNSTAARLQGSTAWKCFQGPTVTTDECYFGLQQKFEQIVFVFGTPGVQNAAITLTWEYWNGSAWTAFTPDTDGTTKFTANGTVKWTITNLTGWATTAVNAITVYWVRVRFTAGSWTTNPLVQTSSMLGWTRAFSGTSQAVYQQGAGKLRYWEINDNAPASGKDARMRGWETMPTWTSYGVNTGTFPFPTAVTYTNGSFVRKSVSADGTARVWLIWADDRTAYVMPVSGDVANQRFAVGFGDFYSLVTSDNYRTLLAGRATENSVANGTSVLPFCEGVTTVTPTATQLDRDYQGAIAGAIKGGGHSDAAKMDGTNNCVGVMQYVNGADGNIYIEHLFIHEATATERGWFRGIYIFLHPVVNIANGDVLTGLAGSSFAGKTFLAVKTVGSNTGTTVLLLETSNTVDTN